MKYPIKYSEIGYYSKINKNVCLFIIKETRNWNIKPYREGTWADFKKEYPFTFNKNGSNCRLRTKKKT